MQKTHFDTVDFLYFFHNFLLFEPPVLCYDTLQQ